MLEHGHPGYKSPRGENGWEMEQGKIHRGKTGIQNIIQSPMPSNISKLD